MQLIEFWNDSPIGAAPGLAGKEVCFDNVQELAKFLKQNPGLAEKVSRFVYWI